MAAKKKAKPHKVRIGTLNVFKDLKGEWRWRLRAANGQIVACSGEGYTRERRCLGGLLAAMRATRSLDRLLALGKNASRADALLALAVVVNARANKPAKKARRR